jgi:pentatricopeptide repeat protein
MPLPAMPNSKQEQQYRGTYTTHLENENDDNGGIKVTSKESLHKKIDERARENSKAILLQTTMVNFSQRGKFDEAASLYREALSRGHKGCCENESTRMVTMNTAPNKKERTSFRCRLETSI